MAVDDAAVRVHGPWLEVCDVLAFTGLVDLVDTGDNLLRFRMDSGATGFAVHDPDTDSVLLPVADFADGGAAADLFRALAALLDFEIELLLATEPPVVLAHRPRRERAALPRPVLRLATSRSDSSIPA